MAGESQNQGPPGHQNRLFGSADLEASSVVQLGGIANLVSETKKTVYFKSVSSKNIQNEAIPRPTLVQQADVVSNLTSPLKKFYYLPAVNLSL